MEALVDHPTFGKIWIKNIQVVDGRIKGQPKRLLIPTPEDKQTVINLSTNRIVTIDD